MTGSNSNFTQNVSVEVIRGSNSKISSKSKIVDNLKEPVICDHCGNKRYWVIRCESCGENTQQVL